MKKEPLFIAFSTQKGGIGKSTFTVLSASYLYYLKGFQIAVIDCDCPQYSLYEMRTRDSEQIMKSNHYKKMAQDQFKTLNKRAYPIAKCRAEDALSRAEELKSNSVIGYDIIFFDLPGTVNSGGILSTLAAMDYIFSPICADRLILESTLSFVDVVNRMLINKGQSQIKGLYLFWNLVDGREKSELYKVYERVIQKLGLTVLKTFVPDTKRFRKELTEDNKAVFRSTLFPTDRRLLKGSRLEELIDEICQIIQL